MADTELLGVSAGHASGDNDYISTLTKLFKDIATAVQDNQQWVVDTFGTEALLQTVLGLQEECDVQVPTLLQSIGILVALAGHCAAAYRAGVQKENIGPVQASLRYME